MWPSASTKAKALKQDLRGKHFVVTGANTGLGYITSRELAKMGAKVTLTCRSAEKGQEAVNKLREEALATPVAEGVDLLEGLSEVDVQAEILDLGSLKSVVAFAQRFKASGATADVLINNAGIMGIATEERTVDGLESQIGVNHFGGHLLTRLMAPVIADEGRVIFLSSVLHEKATLDWENVNYEKPDTYVPMEAYGRSKLANVLDAKEFAKRLSNRRINTYALHPGVVNTDLFRNMSDGRVISYIFRTIKFFGYFVLASPLQGSLNTMRCAIDPALADPSCSGKYWANLKEAPPSALALDSANPPRLWKFTEDLLEEKLGKKIDDLLD
ncbi:unnamed protein product [Hapterophycus canaliculatus]